MDDKLREKILKGTGVLWIIDEPTLVEDMDSLITSYADQMKLQRFKCSFENCNRIDCFIEHKSKVSKNKKKQ